tara:strand:- start:10 stop:762 length:753 start_codon:yes stop_codon:yes gene_type:complete
MNNKFWLYDPSILLKKEKMLELWPNSKLSMAEKLNAVSRSIIVLTTLGYLSTRSFNILVSGIVTLIVIVALYKTKSNENFKEGLRSIEQFKEDLKKQGDSDELMEAKAASNIGKLAATLTKPKTDNPYMNFMINDYVDEPDKKPALPLFNKKVKRKVDKTVSENLDPRLFKDLGDMMEFDAFSRNFHTMPNTTNPNDQKAFAEFCYGNMKSCKEGACFGFINSCKENNYFCKDAYKENSEEGNEKKLESN